MISVVILTKNEADDITNAIRSVASISDDIHVFDSHSTDGTQEIAQSLGAHVSERTFDTYAAQRNASLALPFQHEWVLVLDADERVTPELASEISRVTQIAAADIGAFRIRRRDFLWGTWLKHAQITLFYIRLMRRGHARYVREINELVEVDGRVVELTASFDHFPFSKGITHWIGKHNSYSTGEAKLLATGAAVQDASFKTALFHKDRQSRRAAQKAIFYRLPMRPLFKWCYMVFWRGAILDGHAGLTYATLQSIYEYFIELKRREIERGRP
ncbi:MAG: glycosyltransferase family 2 protein [Acidobacteria bacterium]|nr:glycosyltransferase family 2 protein [Acidobacteriota bacterium]